MPSEDTFEEQLKEMRAVFVTVAYTGEAEMAGFLFDPIAMQGQHSRVPVLELGFFGQMVSEDGNILYDDDQLPVEASCRVLIPANRIQDLLDGARGVMESLSQGDGLDPIPVVIDPVAEVMGNTRREEVDNAEGTEDGGRNDN